LHFAIGLLFGEFERVELFLFSEFKALVQLLFKLAVTNLL